MALPKLQYARTIYAEQQRLGGTPRFIAWVVLALVAIATAAILFAPLAPTPRPPPWPMVLVFLAILAAFGALLFLMRLTVAVTSHEIVVRLFPFWTTRIAIDDVAEVRADEYRPIREYGGWGIRWSLRDSSTCYTMSGTRGVRITTKAGKKYLIGSADADALAAAIDAVRREGL